MVNLILLTCAALLSLLVAYVFWRGKIPKREKKEVALRDLSALWVKGREAGELHLSELAPLWRDLHVSGDQDNRSYKFVTDRVDQFFRQHILLTPWFRNAALHKEVCYQILTRLEQEGDGPSVVKASQDVEASWDSNTFNLLGKTTLLDHTLHVALETIEQLTRDNASHVIPDSLVAALGHDLGKLPSIKGHLYSLGEHPLAAGSVLAEIPQFKELSKKDEIARAIKLHHKRPDGLLGKTLKKADQQARQKELESAMEKVAESKPSTEPDDQSPARVEQKGRADQEEQEQPMEKAKVETEPAPISLPEHQIDPPLLQHKTVTSSSAWKAQADIYGDEEVQVAKSEIPKQIDISSWFDAQGFLDDLKPYINRITGRRWMAFSMANGYVFFQAKALEEVARKQAERAGAMNVATMGQGDSSMRMVLFTVVNRLRIEHEIIARELIKDQYFGGYFDIHMGGKVLKGFYTPFHAEAFGSIAEMENAKTGLLKNIISVEPSIGE